MGSDLGKILTLDQLTKKGVAIANGCYKSHESKETMDYLLHYAKTRLL